MENYPYNLEETIEALNYALSYDRNSTDALCLMGRVYAEKLRDYETAKEYYREALQVNVKALNVFPHFINVLIWNEDYDDAERFIDYALTVKGSNKGLMYLKKAWLLECQKAYKEALKTVKLAKENTYDSDLMYYVDETEKRIKDKMPKKPSTKKSKKKSK